MPLRLKKQHVSIVPVMFNEFGLFRHAADTLPLEGVLSLKRAIHNPLEGWVANLKDEGCEN